MRILSFFTLFTYVGYYDPAHLTRINSVVNPLAEGSKIPSFSDLKESVNSLVDRASISWPQQEANVSDVVTELEDPFLCRSLSPYVDNPKLLEDLPRAKAGHRPVYLPVGADFVIKYFESSEVGERSLKNKYAHRVIMENGLGTVLRVPKTCRIKDYLSEQKFPVSNQRYNFFQYYSHPEYFDEAVIAMIIFLYKVSVGDLRDDDYNIGPRTDNIAPYIERSESGRLIGKLALVDLDHLALPEKGGKGMDLELLCKTVLEFFPFHDEIIQETLNLLDPEFGYNQLAQPYFFEDAKNRAQQSKLMLHWDFLMKKKIRADKLDITHVEEFVYTKDRMIRVNEEIQKLIDSDDYIFSSYENRLKAYQDDVSACKWTLNFMKGCQGSIRSYNYWLSKAPSDEDVKIWRIVSDFTYRFNALFKGENTLTLIVDKIRKDFISELESNVKDKLENLSEVSFPDSTVLRIVKVRNQNNYKREITSLFPEFQDSNKLANFIFVAIMRDLIDENNIATCLWYDMNNVRVCYI